MNKKQAGFATRSIHVGNEPDASTGAVAPPIFATSTYAQEELGKTKGYDYSRAGNPTRTRLEQNLSSLEGGVAARVFSSGMAAVSALASLMKAGEHIVASNNLYGGVPRLFNQILANLGLRFTYVDTTDPRNIAKAIRKNTRFVYIETPTNPLMGLTDIAAVSDIAHKRGCQLVVDNTFMSPYFQQPIKLGADIVLHSTTKFLNGHSDGTGREAGVRAEGGGRYPFPVRVLAGVAWRKDAGGPNAAARSERTRDWRLFEPTPQSEKGLLSGPEEPSTTRACLSPDVRLWSAHHLRNRLTR